VSCSMLIYLNVCYTAIGACRRGKIRHLDVSQMANNRPVLASESTGQHCELAPALWFICYMKRVHHEHSTEAAHLKHKVDLIGCRKPLQLRPDMP
jgi:hypothetical protein